MTLVKFNSENHKKDGNLPAFHNVFDSIFNDSFFTDRSMSRVPAANISESQDHFHGISAKYEDGVLCIDIAKREEAKMVSRQIEIS